MKVDRESWGPPGCSCSRPRLVVAVPGPDGDLPEGMQLVLGGGVGVLHGDLRAELNVRAYGVAERLVVGHADRVQRRQVKLDEPLALLFGDLQVAVDFDQVPEAKLAGEAVRPSEGLCGEPRQVVASFTGPAGPCDSPQQGSSYVLRSRNPTYSCSRPSRPAKALSSA
jgi:hypothetical protein